jgi:hypothetical protein
VSCGLQYSLKLAKKIVIYFSSSPFFHLNVKSEKGENNLAFNLLNRSWFEYAPNEEIIGNVQGISLSRGFCGLRGSGAFCELDNVLSPTQAGFDSRGDLFPGLRLGLPSYAR